MSSSRKQAILNELDDVDLALHFGSGGRVPARLRRRVQEGRRLLRLSELVGRCTVRRRDANPLATLDDLKRERTRQVRRRGAA